MATILVGTAVYYMVHTAFERQLDMSIEQASTALHAEFHDDGPAGLVEAIAVREKSATKTLGFAVFAPDGRRIAGRLDTPMPPLGWHRVVFRDPVEGPDPARAFIAEMDDGTRLVVAADLEPVERIDETILTAFALGLLGVLAIGALLAVILGGYLKRRLDRIASVSQGFAVGNLSQRASVGEHGDEFDQLAAAINGMLERIEALLRNLQQVTSDLAHDMRTPLSHLRRDLEYLQDTDGPERDERIEAAIEKSDEILNLFAAMLRISELEQADLKRHFQILDLTRLVAELEEAHLPLAEDSGHILRLTGLRSGVLAEGDRELLAQALINLLQNALRHTPSDTAIEIGADIEDGKPVLFVRDHGPGIDETDRKRVLERFVRLESARSTPGNGLGLSLAQAIAEAHGARFELRDARPGLKAVLVFERQAA
ncbi:HAMP domain-containing sensor histidine kinase [Novosphingobium malaysiense]|uniref:HAMP domain-containing sensor histidine kinase n=1 Tax=Novosphingobium malaysiense TaxID=1348853 RepID=UPI001E4631A6|nr:ATP-binding protein [Novosphingobium malaysiense]